MQRVKRIFIYECFKTEFEISRDIISYLRKFCNENFTEDMF